MPSSLPPLLTYSRVHINTYRPRRDEILRCQDEPVSVTFSFFSFSFYRCALPVLVRVFLSFLLKSRWFFFLVFLELYDFRWFAVGTWMACVPLGPGYLFFFVLFCI
ncbi:hypothetical protein SERLADRAFT_473344 [Serpula lacrymans var. lacrymans S7.9]|uniref:Transmembrane protein n=1 Tax=Serpula lacrymans var. lacrymans (strain S7.9) TaxID=578457 RepID=F8P2T9_SERL9|nr:uncharacterized protein SERLADRAFT_473344 [Serpula lacrymans var. lacrymans S7.9]EGO22474.1 hypothetical protein SERLADRAFT_473344 [Serpula lacrymans var. lacrymans S7.9]